MVAKKAPPVQGAVYVVSLDPTLGHEERGMRPVFVVSPEKYNSTSGLALVCPMTSRQKGYPFEVVCNVGNISGVVLVDQVRAIDWRARPCRYVGDAELSVLAEVRAKLRTLLG